MFHLREGGWTVNRTVGVTLRRYAGSGVIFALGFGALSVAPHDTAPVAASAATSSASVISTVTVNPRDDIPQRIRPIALITVTSAAPVPAASPRARHLAAATVTTGAVAARPVLTRSSRSADASAFAYGYCTWWVAQKRDIPWRGDAAQWWWNARAFGFAEGQTPRVGAIMVMGAGGSASPEGHVAYVEKVNANGSFVVSEMNWWGVPGGGWGRVDYRTVTSRQGILGFIY
jgi:surface antigen